jgi:hypothetical protein
MIKDGEFYQLNVSSASAVMFVDIEGDYDTIMNCMHGRGSDEESFSANFYMGRTKPSDFVRTTYANPLLISDKVRTLLIENRVTGWKSWPCHIVGKHGENYEYHFLGVSGQCGPIKHNVDSIVSRKSGLIDVEYVRGMYFDLSEWDGSDICMPKRTGHRIVTKRVRDIFVKNKIKHCEMTDIREVEVNKLILEIAGVKF